MANYCSSFRSFESVFAVIERSGSYLRLRRTSCHLYYGWRYGKMETLVLLSTFNLGMGLAAVYSKSEKLAVRAEPAVMGKSREQRSYR